MCGVVVSGVCFQFYFNVGLCLMSLVSGFSMSGVWCMLTIFYTEVLLGVFLLVDSCRLFEEIFIYTKFVHILTLKTVL